MSKHSDSRPVLEGVRPDPEIVLEGLKDFQRDSVEYVFRRLYTDQDCVDRFLIADEVGLGKTMVARGLIAKAIDHLWDEPEHRIDVIYICSNRDIAQQNIRKLDVSGEGFAFSSRMTLIAQKVAGLRARKVNFVSFTPSTSFDVTRSLGQANERYLLWALLRRPEMWGRRLLDRVGARRILQGHITELSTFDQGARAYEQKAREIDEQLLAKFRDSVVGTDLLGRFEELAHRVARRERFEQDESSERASIIGELRNRLAVVCVDALEPDLVILDEFQRFRDVLTGESEAGELASSLFNFPGNKTVMLSATPYKAYTLSGEADDDHHADFLRTVDFLLGRESHEFRGALQALRSALIEAHLRPPAEIGDACRLVEGHLRKVMSRVERLSSRVDHNGMLREAMTIVAPATADDIRGFVALEQLARAIDAGGMVEYWKSAPCFLNFLEGYKVAEKLELATSDGDGDELRRSLRAAPGKIKWSTWERFGSVDSGNARFRHLAAEMVESGAWKLMWLPPSLPYYEPRGPWAEPGVAGLTKRLIFTAWNAAPKGIASLLSYDVERRLSTLRDETVRNSKNGRKSRSGRLNITRNADSGRLQGMPTIGLITPSRALAELGDPPAAAGTSPVDGEKLLGDVSATIDALLGPLRDRAGEGSRPDEAWYWAAPMLLDRLRGHDRLSDPDLDAKTWRGEEERQGLLFDLHLDHARAVLDGSEPLGPLPADLADVLALVAVAAPANVAYRSIGRVFDVTPTAQWRGAARVAWGFRSLFNLPEVTPLIQSQYEDPYWQGVLNYCFDGCLSAVLDEYVHAVTEWDGLRIDSDDAVIELANNVVAAVSLGSVTYRAHDPLKPRASGSRPMRSRFALRFGDQRSARDDAGDRSIDVRRAFNSPFWPFVLASTSVGQEGLDFHLYCHAVVHWNLPPNPVDLEQREGRVHRFKGHAIRKNVADAHRDVGLSARGDPWKAMFDAAVAGRDSDENDLVPFWLYPGEHAVERHVPMLPFSKEIARFDDLKRATALYRLVFGQPRQEDLLGHLRRTVEPERLDELVEQMRVSLAPPSARGTDENSHESRPRASGKAGR
jgi:helicase-like protein